MEYWSDDTRKTGIMEEWNNGEKKNTGDRRQKKRTGMMEYWNDGKKKKTDADVNEFTVKSLMHS